MPDKRTHRGPDPRDAKLFSASAASQLRLAVADYSLLLSKGYAEKSALKLVGDRFSLTARQRIAVMRCACSDEQLEHRRKTCVPIENIAGRPIMIDGYNILITTEAALSNAVIFKGRDGCLRDIAGIHGTYRKVSETIPAFKLLGLFLDGIGVTEITWLLDSPVSNSGRLRKIMTQIAEGNNFNWQITLLQNPDAELIKTDLTVATSDSVILYKCQSWVNLLPALIKRRLTDTNIIDLS